MPLLRGWRYGDFPLFAAISFRFRSAMPVREQQQSSARKRSDGSPDEPRIWHRARCAAPRESDDDQDGVVQDMLEHTRPNAAGTPAHGAEDQPKHQAGQQPIQTKGTAENDVRHTEQQTIGADRHQDAATRSQATL